MSDNNKDKNHELSEQEKSVLLDHDYDGIQEFDYPLPTWWTASFLLTAVFGIPYIIFYIFLGGPTLKDELNEQMVVINEAKALQAQAAAVFTIEEYEAHKNNDGVNKGSVVFVENCQACHEAGGKGDIGPNLTDAYWLRAKGTPDSIYDIVTKGSEENGMPPWGEVLSKEQILDVTAYVMSLKNTNVPGKEPQGEKIEE